MLEDRLKGTRNSWLEDYSDAIACRVRRLSDTGRNSGDDSSANEPCRAPGQALPAAPQAEDCRGKCALSSVRALSVPSRAVRSQMRAAPAMHANNTAGTNTINNPIHVLRLIRAVLSGSQRGREGGKRDQHDHDSQRRTK
jgi:hypothetical protein